MTKETEFLETVITLVWNDISKQELVEMIRDRKKALEEQLTIPVVMCSVCKGTGKIKYKEIEEVMYSWQPWKTRNCSCENYS